jgi:hypothetical protein
MRKIMTGKKEKRKTLRKLKIKMRFLKRWRKI